MTNLEKYDREFIRMFGVKKEELPELKYQGILQWDSVGHLDLISTLEEVFDISLNGLDVMEFSSYEAGKEVLKKYGIEMEEPSG
ncbi:MAG: acyl carrier protein [Lachnospiraceae bacterium]|nr:acyl carrier protein [Lachnospiraceae bacterium]